MDTIAHNLKVILDYFLKWQTNMPDMTSPYLQTPVKCSLNGNTLAGMGSIGGNGSNEGVQLVFFLFQLFHQALDGPLGKGFTLPSLSVAHQAVHNAQAGVIASRCVGDRHFDFWLSMGAFRRQITDKVSSYWKAKPGVILMLERFNSGCGWHQIPLP